MNIAETTGWMKMSLISSSAAGAAHTERDGRRAGGRSSRRQDKPSLADDYCRHSDGLRLRRPTPPPLTRFAVKAARRGYPRLHGGRGEQVHPRARRVLLTAGHDILRRSSRTQAGLIRRHLNRTRPSLTCGEERSPLWRDPALPTRCRSRPASANRIPSKAVGPRLGMRCFVVCFPHGTAVPVPKGMLRGASGQKTQSLRSRAKPCGTHTPTVRLARTDGRTRRAKNHDLEGATRRRADPDPGGSGATRWLPAIVPAISIGGGAGATVRVPHRPAGAGGCGGRSRSPRATGVYGGHGVEHRVGDRPQDQRCAGDDRPGSRERRLRSSGPSTRGRSECTAWDSRATASAGRDPALTPICG